MPTESESIFLDRAIDTEFKDRGYALIPVLTKDAVEGLLEMRQSKRSTLPRDFYPTAVDPDAGYRNEIQKALDAVVSPKVLPLLNGYKNCTAGFVDKRANTRNGRIGIHQDYSFVDQSRHIGVRLWLPLVDVDERNACLQLFPGTHSLVNHVATVPTGPSPYDSVMPLLERECGVPVPMAAGVGLFFDGRLLHCSHDNRSSAERPAVSCIYLPQDARMRLFVRRADSSTVVDVVEVDNFSDIHLADSRFTTLNSEGVRRIGMEEQHVRPLKPSDIAHLRVHRSHKLSWLSRVVGG